MRLPTGTDVLREEPAKGTGCRPCSADEYIMVYYRQFQDAFSGVSPGTGFGETNSALVLALLYHGRR